MPTKKPVAKKAPTPKKRSTPKAKEPQSLKDADSGGLERLESYDWAGKDPAELGRPVRVVHGRLMVMDK